MHPRETTWCIVRKTAPVPLIVYSETWNERQNCRVKLMKRHADKSPRLQPALSEEMKYLREAVVQTRFSAADNSVPLQPRWFFSAGCFSLVHNLWGRALASKPSASTLQGNGQTILLTDCFEYSGFYKYHRQINCLPSWAKI